MTIDKFSKLSHLNPEIKLDLSFFYTKEALQVFWVQRYDLLSQINYHKYFYSQWINQSIIKSIYKSPKTPWSKVLIQTENARIFTVLFIQS